MDSIQCPYQIHRLPDPEHCFLYKSLIGCNIGLMVIGKTHRVLHASDVWLSKLQKPVDKVIDNNIHSVMKGNLSPKTLERCLEAHEPIDSEQMAQEGSGVFDPLYVLPIYDPGGQKLGTMLLTFKQSTKTSLRLKTKTALLQLPSEDIIILDADGRIVFSTVFDEGRVGMSWIDVACGGKKFDENGNYLSPLIEALETGVDKPDQIRNQNNRYYRMTTRIIRDDCGQILGVLNFRTDVTEKVIMENQLRHAERLTLMGEITGSLVHQIREPLATMLATIQVAQTKTDSADLHMYLNRLQRQVQQLNRVIGEMLALSRKNEGEVTFTNINKLVENTLAMLGALLSQHRIRIEKSYTKHIPAISINTVQMQQVFMNIVTNAVHAMPSGGRLEIKTSRTGEMIRVDFKDNGTGMDSETMHRLFDPFFSTKKDGIGLGMSISRQIVTKHNGRIHCESKPGAGTLVSVELPLTEGESGLLQ